jgi:hypothetical protein
MTIGPQQFWLRPACAGQLVTVWIDITTCHLSIGGWRVKAVPRTSTTQVSRVQGLRHVCHPPKKSVTPITA